MDRYVPLGKYLQKQSQTSVTLTFRQIEEIIGRLLPASAFIHPAWWANDTTHIQAKAWLSADREVKLVDLTKRTATFVSRL